MQLRRNSNERQPLGPVVLVILDGVGVGRGDEFDAVATADTPVLDQLLTEGVSTTLRAHGPAVGLASEGDMGNSEVGHNTLGAGRIYPQGAYQVDRALSSGELFGTEWSALLDRVQNSTSTLHLIGLLSDGGVHSSFTQFIALIERAADDGVKRMRLHVLLDGRDVPDFSAHLYLDRLKSALAHIERQTGCDIAVASGGGRMSTTMDRYGANWQIVEAGWHAHVLGDARPFASAEDAVATARDERPGLSDQDIPPFTVVDKAGTPVGRINDGDAVLLFNFRGDRAIELAEALAATDNFRAFQRIRAPKIALASLVEYDSERGFPEHHLLSPPMVPDTVSELLAEAGVDQFACAETQKFGHVTYFWNGNRAEKFDPARETYVEIASEQVAFQLRPAMRSKETAEEVAAAIERGRDRFIRTNLAGGDMVGHTGNLDAARTAIEAIDAAIGVIAAATRAKRGCLVVTADHGNAEDMVERDERGDPRRGVDGAPIGKTAHSLNRVRFLVRDFGSRAFRLRDDLPDAGLANVAATLLELLGFDAPSEYETSLISWTSTEP